MLKMEVINRKTNELIDSMHGTNDELTNWYQSNKDKFGDINSYRVHVSDASIKEVKAIEKAKAPPKKKWWKFGKDKSL